MEEQIVNNKELQEMKFAFEITWQAIGMDILMSSGMDSIDRDTVIETVLDADRLLAYCDNESKPVVEKFQKLPYAERICIARNYFTFEQYGA